LRAYKNEILERGVCQTFGEFAAYLQKKNNIKVSSENILSIEIV